MKVVVGQELAVVRSISYLLDEHIGHVAERIKALRALEKELRALRAACPVPHASADCAKQRQELATAEDAFLASLPPAKRARLVSIRRVNLGSLAIERPTIIQ